MTVLVVEPMKIPYLKEIDGTLESMQKLVEGSIEVIYPFADHVAVVCNEEGKLGGFPINRDLYYDGNIVDVLCGTFFICGLGDTDFASLSPDLIEKYERLFKHQQVCIRRENDM